MNVIEYLYVDKKRVNSYVEQIRSPITYDKVPIWKAVISFTGAKAEATQSRPVREITLNEKIISLQEYLQKNKLVANRREKILKTKNDLVFVQETFNATKIHIPSNLKEESNELFIWLSPRKINNRIAGWLCLIEDYKGIDSEQVEADISGFSLFYDLIDIINEEQVKSIVVDYFFQEGKSNTSKWDLFFENPVKLLADAGCKAYPPRMINCLYRVRSWGEETDFNDNYYDNIFGYPIFIADSLGFK